MVIKHISQNLAFNDSKNFNFYLTCRQIKSNEPSQNITHEHHDIASWAWRPASLHLECYNFMHYHDTKMQLNL
jgi:hypothetical protein